YSDRPVYFLSVSHNMILDVASLRLLGEKICRESLRTIAAEGATDYEASRPLEGRSIRLEGDALIVSFRGQEKRWTPSELEELVRTDGILEQEAQERAAEWQTE
ncbi:MAG: hypothetical protein V1685_02065, partial [Parcubacteria group bacterium]